MALGVPLRILNRTIGALVFTFNDYREFSPEELSMLVTLGSRCAGALERASLYERDRDIALTFQRRLMPALPRTPPWIEIAAGYRPASGMAIGGDWYQVLDAGGGRVAPSSVMRSAMDSSPRRQWGSSARRSRPQSPTTPNPNHAIAAVDLFAVQGADTIGASAGVRPVRSRWPCQVCQRRPCSVGAVRRRAMPRVVCWKAVGGHCSGFRAPEEHTADRRLRRSSPETSS